MSKRGKLVGLVLAVALLGALAFTLLRSSDVLTFGSDAGVEGGFDESEVAGLAANAAADGGLRRSGASAGGDAGLAFDPATWLPTASVSPDPSSPHGSLTGRVVSSGTGEGIAGAELVFEHDGATASVRSGSGGAFALSASGEGRHVLAIASAEGFLPFAPEWGHSPIAFTARAHQRIDGITIHLVPAVEYVVDVVARGDTGDDSPVEGASVRLAGAGTGERAMAPVRARYTTDAEGRVRVEAWDRALIEAAHEDHGRGRAIVTQRAQHAHRVRIRLVPTNGGSSPDESIGGLVLDARGAAVEGAVVRASLQRRGLHPSGRAVSGPDGRFEIPGLDRGPHALRAAHPEHPDVVVGRIQAGRADVELRFPDGLAIEGRVVDQEGQPIPAFNIAVRRARGPLVRQTVAMTSGYDPDGRFRVGGLGEGDFDLVATSRGYPPSAPVAVTLGGTASPSVTLTLSRGGRIEGVVRSATDDQPIAGARVSLEGRLGRGASASPVLASSVSGEDGSYALDGIGDSLRSVRVTAEGHHARILSGFTVAPGATRRMDIELTPLEEGEEPRTELAGIGAVLSARGEILVIRRVVAGGGAQEAGLQPGDAILAIDGTPVTALGFGGSIDRIRGPEGRTVVLSVRRRGQETAADVAVTRRRVRT